MALSAQRPRKLEFRMRAFRSANRMALRKARVQVAKEIQADIRRKISKPFPPASSPGAHPHSRTGRLKAKVSVKAEGNQLVVRVPQYGVWLESGTRRMRPRPFIRRNVEQKRWFKRIVSLARKFNTKK